MAAKKRYTQCLTRDNNYFNNKYITGALSPEGIISGVVLCVVSVAL